MAALRFLRRLVVLHRLRAVRVDDVVPQSLHLDLVEPGLGGQSKAGGASDASAVGREVEVGVGLRLEGDLAVALDRQPVGAWLLPVLRASEGVDQGGRRDW
jgi:hypothetical protein